jgi:zinc/manganese transport system substrate-binding protein
VARPSPSPASLPVARPGPRLAATLITCLLAFAWIGPPSVVAESDPGQTVVVTTAILGAIVTDVVDGEQDVTVDVLMDGAADPHEWEASARDIEAIYGADVVVANGLGLEPSLVSALSQAASEGVTVFEAGDHVQVRRVSPEGTVLPSGSPEAAGSMVADPHFWLDPLAMRDVVSALDPVLATNGIDVGDQARLLERRLEALDGEVRDILAAIPPDRRQLVTGHESLGYFAERYGFTVVGVVIPGFSTQGEVSARALADLTATIRATRTPALFVEPGTPTSVADAVAAETGAQVIVLAAEQLPADGSYFTLMREVADTIASALGGS